MIAGLASARLQHQPQPEPRRRLSVNAFELKILKNVTFLKTAPACFFSAVEYIGAFDCMCLYLIPCAY
jgi:hypothetical protein